MKAKRVIAIAACMVMILSLAACGIKSSETSEAKKDTAAAAEVENVEIPNPWTECSDIKEAEENAGFSFEVPEEIEGCSIDWIQNMDKEMIEVIYATSDGEAAEEEDNSIHLRKGSGTEDISGDCNDYPESNQVTIASYNVTMQGNNGLVSLATWTDGGFSYSVSVPGMNVESVTAIIQQMK